jgi:hypothetical protein
MSNTYRDGTSAALIAPSLPDTLAPLPGETSFVLPVVKRAGPLKVVIEKIWPGYMARNRVTFFRAHQAIQTFEVINPDPTQFPMTFNVTQIALTMGGLHELFYTVETSGGISTSDSVHLDLDNIPPNLGVRPNSLQFPLEIIEHGVTQQYLDTNGDRVTATVLSWPDIKLGDELWFYLQPSAKTGNSTAAEAGRKIITASDLALPEIEVAFAGDVFRALGKVNCYGYYFLKDRAGNEGPNSYDSPIFPIHVDPPLHLLAPQVPLYDQHGLIDEQIARTPVQVVIAGMTSIAQNDQIQVHWGAVDLPLQPVLDPAANPLLRLNVPYRVVQTAGDGTILVSYDLWRGGASIGHSPATRVLVDITLPAGPDPDPETPEHENLMLPTALGESGVPNVISPADQEQPAEVIIEWYGADGTEVFMVGDEIVANWATVALLHTVDAGEAVAKQPLRLPISSPQIKQAGQGTLQLRYSVTRELPGHPGYSNTVYSASQVLLVSDGTELPGGGDELSAGDFPEKNQNNAINNDAAIDGTPYEVKLDYRNAAVGDIITFKFRGHLGFGDDPALEPGRPIAGSYTEGQHVVTQEDLDHGSYAFTVERQYLAAIRQASANGYHWIRNYAGETPAAYYHVFVDVTLAP